MITNEGHTIGLRTNNLVLEVTRRCNMSCRHCMRGEAQAVDMSEETMRKAISMLDDIGSISFTGGEPTLNLPLIRHTFDLCKAKYGSIPPFFIVTNGKERQLELLRILAEAWGDNREPESCAVCLSVDDFHEPTPGPDYLRALSFYRDEKEHELGQTDEENRRWLIDDGRASINRLGGSFNLLANRLYSEWDILSDSISCNIEELYISAKAEIMASCDYSYEGTGPYNYICDLDELPDLLGTELKRQLKRIA